MDELLIPISSSFVKRRLKLQEDRGSGESKLFIGSQKNELEYDSFFNNFSSENEYIFEKENIINYLKYAKMEYIAQKCNKYKNIDIEFYNKKYKLVSEKSDEIQFVLNNFKDGSRYYVRSSDSSKSIFDEIFREIALPKITNVLILRKQNKYIFNLELNYDEICKRNSKENSIKDSIDINLEKPHQRIFFGAPGTGKSYKLNNEANEYFKDNYERVTFHPNYMYSNFIGVFKPFPVKIENEEGNIKENITYKYVPGILLKMILKSLINPSENYLLIIEEINRANVYSIFGEFFQLLDRDENGDSQYHINISEDIKLYIQERLEDCEEHIKIKVITEIGENYDKLILPKNLYIWATMNSADQGVMPLDTAFKRRWEFEYIGINEGEDEISNKYIFKISKDGKCTYWNEFRREVNNILSECRIPEDKLMGPYFIPKHILEKSDVDELTQIIFNKVLMYLYEDIGRAHRNQIFNQEYSKTFSSLRDIFNEDIALVFKKSLNLSEADYKDDIEYK